MGEGVGPTVGEEVGPEVVVVGEDEVLVNMSAVGGDALGMHSDNI